MGEGIVNFGKYISNISESEFKFLGIGVILGIIIMIIFKSTYIFKQIKSRPAESILVTSITMVVFLQIFKADFIDGMSTKVLTFISTMAFSWMMTKYSVKNDYEIKQKEISALSYKHSVGIKNKLEFTLLEIDRYIMDVVKCSNKENCNLRNKFENIKSQIAYSYEDAIGNVNDWAVNISEEISNYEQIVKIERQIEEKEDEYNFNSSQDQQNVRLKGEIIKLKKEKKQLLDGINPKVLYLIKTSKEDAKQNEATIIKSRINKLNKKEKVS